MYVCMYELYALSIEEREKERNIFIRSSFKERKRRGGFFFVGQVSLFDHH
jgi:hypothetical protein